MIWLHSFIGVPPVNRSLRLSQPMRSGAFCLGFVFPCFFRLLCAPVFARSQCVLRTERTLTEHVLPGIVSQVAKKLQKKQKNVVDEGVKKLREKREAEQGREKVQEEERKREAQARQAPAALGRFFKK